MKTQTKVSELMPFLRIIAHQNKFRLNRYKELKKALQILELSILNN
jgi:hypothetical protein